MFTAFYFWGGVADLFLSLMLWFVLNEVKTTSIMVDGDRVYAVV